MARGWFAPPIGTHVAGKGKKGKLKVTKGKAHKNIANPKGVYGDPLKRIKGEFIVKTDSGTIYHVKDGVWTQKDWVGRGNPRFLDSVAEEIQTEQFPHADILHRYKNIHGAIEYFTIKKGKR